MAAVIDYSKTITPEPLATALILLSTGQKPTEDVHTRGVDMDQLTCAGTRENQ